MSVRLALPVALALLPLVFVAPARAQAPTADHAVEEAARLHFQRGVQDYKSESYRAALEEFQAGYALLPKVRFLVNLAQTCRQLGELARARDFYQRFIDATPADDPERAAAVDMVDKLTRDLDAQRPAVAVAPPPPSPVALAVVAPPPPPPRRWYRDVAGGALVGAGLVVAAGGVAQLAYESALIGDATHDLRDYTAARSASTWGWTGGATLAVGCVLIGGGIVRYAIVGRRAPRRAAADAAVQARRF